MSSVNERIGLNSTPFDLPSRQDNLFIEGTEWKDWTSTWRKVGDSSQTKHVTMTGTITRGKKRGQSVDIELDLTEHELTQLSNDCNEVRNTYGDNRNNENDEKPLYSCCNLTSGLHIAFLGMFCVPFVIFAAFLVCLYFGLLTWYNIFSYYYDERTICHRIFFCPLLILIFPIFIIITAIFIAIYASVIQISWTYDDWKNEIGSFEKGFYGWLCSFLSLEACSPYSVVVLTDPDDIISSNLSDSNHASVVEETVEPDLSASHCREPCS